MAVIEHLHLYRALRPLMSGVGSRETGLVSLFALKPVGPGFEPCLGQSIKLAGAPKPLCLSVCMLLLWSSVLLCIYEVGSRVSTFILCSQYPKAEK